MAEYIEKNVAIARLTALEIGNPCATMPDAKRQIADTRAVDVAPVVHGRWEIDADGDWYCTNCDEVVAICESGRERTYRKPYCPNCGAKMDGGGSDEADR